MLRITTALCSIALLASLAGAHANDIHRWTDANGRVHFGDRPPEDADAAEVSIRVNTYEAPSPIMVERVLGIGRQRVVVYSTTWCGVCTRVKRYLNTNSIPYTEYDVENSRKGRRDYARLRGTGVPIVIVGDQRMNGFSKARMNTMLRNAGFTL